MSDGLLLSQLKEEVKMVSYVHKNLTSNEEIQHQCKISKWHLFPQIFAGFTFLLAGAAFGIDPETQSTSRWLYGIGLYLQGWALIYYFTTELAVTNKRIISKTGFIRRKTIEINITKLESVTVDQGILARILKFGSVTASGTGGSIAPIKGIHNPLAFRKLALETSEVSTKG